MPSLVGDEYRIVPCRLFSAAVEETVSWKFDYNRLMKHLSYIQWSENKIH